MNSSPDLIDTRRRQVQRRRDEDEQQVRRRSRSRGGRAPGVVRLSGTPEPLDPTECNVRKHGAGRV
eukprot:8876963-Prorocentrum_lima.AAC.1